MTTPDNEEREAMMEFITRSLAFTARLTRVEAGRPLGGGSGILYQRDKRLFLLSVLHVFEKHGWIMETDFVEKERPLCLELPDVNWLVSAKVDNGKVSVPGDGLAWVEFSGDLLRKRLQDLRLDPANVSLRVYCGPIDRPAEAGHAYGFGAYRLHAASDTPFGGWLAERRPTYELYMQFQGEDERGYYKFKLARPHQGHDFYAGASGAPIADEKGVVVALVQGGCAEDDIIFGIPTSRYASAILG